MKHFEHIFSICYSSTDNSSITIILHILTDLKPGLSVTASSTGLWKVVLFQHTNISLLDIACPFTELQFLTPQMGTWTK